MLRAMSPARERPEGQRCSTGEVCLVCGQRAFEPHLEILLRCATCGFVTARTEGPVDAARLYDAAYFTGGEYLDYRADEAFFRRNFRKRLRGVLARCDGGRLIELGAAYGFFLDLAREHFDVVGYEVNPEAAAFARGRFGVDVRTGSFLDAAAADVGGPADVMAMWDVIEHLERPDAFLAHAAELLRPGGMIFLTTGDIGSFVARVRGRRWRMIHPPTHLHYFSQITIRRLLEHTGFRVLEIRSTGVARSIRQILYSVLALKLGMPRAYHVAAKIVPRGAGITLNTFDIMHVVARRD